MRVLLVSASSERPQRPNGRTCPTLGGVRRPAKVAPMMRVRALWPAAVADAARPAVASAERLPDLPEVSSPDERASGPRSQAARALLPSASQASARASVAAAAAGVSLAQWRALGWRAAFRGRGRRRPRS